MRKFSASILPPSRGNAISAIRQAWLEHGVIFFRAQDLPPAKFLHVAKCFGDVVEYPFIKGIEGYPAIIPVVKLEHERHNFGGIWHTDTVYLDTPPMVTMPIAREVPPCGGDTLFTIGYLAHETFSDGMKRMLDGLVAINSSAKADVSRTREDRVRDSAKADAKRNMSANIRWCARTRRRSARRSTSTSRTHCASTI